MAAILVSRVYESQALSDEHQTECDILTHLLFNVIPKMLIPGFPNCDQSEMSRDASLRAIQLMRMQHMHSSQRSTVSESSASIDSNTSLESQRRHEQERKRIFSTLVAVAAEMAPPMWPQGTTESSNVNNNSAASMPFKNQSPPMPALGNGASQGEASSQMVLYAKMQAFRRMQHQQRLQQSYMNNNSDMFRSGMGANHMGFASMARSNYAFPANAATGPMMPQGHGQFLSHMGANRHSTSTVMAGPPGSIPLCLPVALARRDDALKVSSLQVLLRHQIEAFQATEEDATTHTRGRNKAVKIDQVGIRCRHCAHLPVLRRQKGSTYFPASVFGLYQASQNMSTTHMQNGLCSEMPDAIKAQFAHLVATKVSSAGAGRPYWAATAKELGLVDTEEGIYFIRNLPLGANILPDMDKAVTTPRNTPAARTK
jgi:hypothetical protein